MFHNMMINLSKSLGFSGAIDEEVGVCDGFALAAAQAYVLQKAIEKDAAQRKIQHNDSKKNEFLRFTKRLHYIKKHHTTLPIQIAKAREENRTKKVNRTDIHEVASLVEVIDLYQNPHRYSNVFGKHLAQIHPAEISYFSGSAELEIWGGLIEVDSFPGIYSLEELPKYIALLDDQARLTKTALTLLLSCGDHTLCLCYDDIKDTWILIDINIDDSDIPVKEFREVTQFTIELFGSFFASDLDMKVAFNTLFITSGNRKEEMQSFVDNLKNNQQFNILHKLNKRKAVMDGANGITLAYLAAKFGHMDILRNLCAYKTSTGPLSGTLLVNFNEVGDNEATPVFIAAQNGQIEVLKFLATLKDLDKKLVVDFNKARKSSGATPAFVAIKTGQVEVLKFFATLREPNGEFIIDFNRALINGVTPVYVAAQDGHVKVLEFLATLIHPNGKPVVDFNQEVSFDSYTVTPAYIAAQNGHIEVLKFLATLEQANGELAVNINQAASNGMTPLDVAAQMGHVEILRMLAELKKSNGTPVIDFNQIDGAKLAFLAAGSGHVEVLRYLATLECNGKKVIDFSQTIGDNVTLAYIAAQNGHVEVLKFLATLNQPNCTLVINFNKARSNGVTPEDIAIEKGHINVSKFFISLKNPYFEALKVESKNYQTYLITKIEEVLVKNKITQKKDSKETYAYLAKASNTILDTMDSVLINQLGNNIHKLIALNQLLKDLENEEKAPQDKIHQFANDFQQSKVFTYSPDVEDAKHTKKIRHIVIGVLSFGIYAVWRGSHVGSFYFWRTGREVFSRKVATIDSQMGAINNFLST